MLTIQKTVPAPDPARSGSLVEHTVDEFDLQLLRQLEKPKKLSMLEGEADMQGDVVELRVKQLQENGLVFRDENRFGSLIVDLDCDAGYI